MIEKSPKLGKNISDIQEINRALVLKKLRENTNCSRSDIAKITGLQQATITKIVSDLIGCGIVSEASLIKNERGRRSIGLSLNSEHYRIIGVRLTRTSILAGLYDIAGKEYHFEKEKINIAEGPNAAMMKMNSVIHRIMSSTDNKHILGIGIGLPGPFLKEEGVIAVMADFPGWEGWAIHENLKKEFGDIVYTVHDAYANALAEWYFGEIYRDTRILLSISMEEGLGAGLVVESKLYTGTQGIACEIGHFSIDYNGIPCACGNKGCLRNYCAEVAVINRAYDAIPQHPESRLKLLKSIQLSDIIDSAIAGDEFSIKLIQEAGRFLGIGLINTIYAYNPDKIVLSREFAAAGDLFLDPVKRVLQTCLLPAIYNNVSVVFSRIEKDPVLMGAIALVTDRIFMNPSYFMELSKASLSENEKTINEHS